MFVQGAEGGTSEAQARVTLHNHYAMGPHPKNAASFISTFKKAQFIKLYYHFPI